ncbi:hypothetical protein DVH24_000409 [Malus domestica]|uniref:Retrotransposon Copia-like N-terminal domain-containing protein n=1 Tax=Malus domestica TaxID=3750 RepID=A0A498IZU9_MALDO|nr:hypothetical protein DVH24_000409 [Malus domestica]
MEADGRNRKSTVRGEQTINLLDNPGHMIVSEKLNGPNYPSWSKSIIHALTAKNKIDCIDGSIQPSSTTDQPKECALLNQCNNMILSWLAQSVESDPSFSTSLIKILFFFNFFIKVLEC